MKHVLGSFGAAIACAVVALAPASCGGGSGGGGNPSTDFGKMDGTCFYGNCEDVDDPDATVEEDGESPEEGGKPDVPAPPPVENPELVLKITGPTGAGFASTPGAQISLSGVVFGRYASITWMNEKTGESRDAGGTAPYWQTESIGVAPFEPNRIRVTAVGENETVSDTIVVMYNPGFYFPYPVDVKPPSVFAGDTSRVHVTMTLGAFGSMVGDKLRLQQVDAAGNPVKEHGQMTDDGDVTTHGDEVEGDGVYSTQVSVTCSTPGPIYLRVGATAKNFDGSQFDAWSAPVPVDCVARLTESTCMAHQATLKAARQAYEGAVGNGLAAARQAAIDALKADSSVTEVAQVAEAGGIWAAFDDGVLGALNLAAEGTRGGAGEGGGEAACDGGTGAIESGLLAGKIPVLTKDTLLLSPFISEFGSDDEVQLIGGVASQLSCPAFFSVKGPYNNQAAGLSQFRKMSRHP
ncbi:MAG: hypothetical protein FJ087_01370, partial [Deltaproteobacteria bacterium]|nr:hypothetical protein [Deltaproteobacteria bacterium]